MSGLKNRIKALEKLGYYLSNISKEDSQYDPFFDAIDRAQLGAVQSRLNFTNDQLNITKENLQSAISRVADVDIATEATNYARYQILVQSGTQMLTQANNLPNAALQLLRQ